MLNVVFNPQERPLNGDAVAGVALEPPHYIGIEPALDPSSHAARRAARNLRTGRKR
jgi:hypothetical protein